MNLRFLNVAIAWWGWRFFLPLV